MKSIAIVECVPDRAEFIKNLVEKARPDLSVSVFPVYKNIFPDFSFEGYIYSGG